MKKGESHMVNKLFTLLFASVLVFPLSTAVFAQEAPKEAKAAKPARWEGIVIRVSKDKSTLTVRDVASSHEKTVQYDSSTKWVSVDLSLLTLITMPSQRAGFAAFASLGASCANTAV